jgi:hypothetical protein
VGIRSTRTISRWRGCGCYLFDLTLKEGVILWDLNNQLIKILWEVNDEKEQRANDEMRKEGVIEESKCFY